MTAHNMLRFDWTTNRCFGLTMNHTFDVKDAFRLKAKANFNLALTCDMRQTENSIVVREKR